MPRVKRGFKARRRRNRIMRHASGFHSARGRQFASAIEAVHNAWQYAYAHRKLRKRDFRRLWIARINAAVRSLGSSYSRLVFGLKKANVGLDRKILADLAVVHPDVFKAIAQKAGVAAA